MALFLTQQTLYRVIQRELPEDVYPDSGRPADFLSTAESWAQAKAFESFYGKLEENYDNQWPQTADASGIEQLELAHFGRLSTGLSLEERAARLLRKYRELPSLSQADLTVIVERELPDGTPVELVGWNTDIGGGSWHLGVSELGVTTIIGGSGAHAYPLGTDLCLQDGSDVGLSAQDWTEYRENAYTYEVRIYEYTPTAAELEAIEQVLNLSEAARDRHITMTNVAAADFANPYLPPMDE